MANHIHKLKRHKYSTGNKVFFCTLPDCHFKIDTALALGKRALCNICLNEFVMDEYTIKLARPHCRNCGKIKVREGDKTFYVNKPSTPVTNAIAESTVSSLRNRLDSVSVVEEDKDI